MLGLASGFLGLTLLLPTTRAQPSPGAPLLPVNPSVPTALPPSPAAKFRTPRETLKTLYFSLSAYDLHPALIDDAVACLEVIPDQQEVDELARRSIELDVICQELCLPINGVPENPPGDQVVVYEAEGFRIGLRRRNSGDWCFDQDTVERIPAMYCLALRRHADLPAEQTNLHEELTNPSASLRCFLLDGLAGDYYAASQALDLSSLSAEQRRKQASRLAQQLLFVMQRRGWVFFEEIPHHPDGPPYTWHADQHGRIILERVRLADGKDAWLFSKHTVRNLERMYQAAIEIPPDSRYSELGRLTPPVTAEGATSAAERPFSVPPHLSSPRAVLQGFFAAMSETEPHGRRPEAALAYLDLAALPAADRHTAGLQLAGKLDALLRKLTPDLDTIPDSWNAPPQVLGAGKGLRVELVRLRDGTWRFSAVTMERLPHLFEQLAAQEQAAPRRTGHLESARDTLVSFLLAGNHHDDERAACCLDLGALHPGARAEAGAVLARKLRFVLDLTRPIYPQTIPNEPDGPRHLVFRDSLGRIVLARKNDGPDRGRWLVTAESVEQIEALFLAALSKPLGESAQELPAGAGLPTFWQQPGIWVRLSMPDWATISVGDLNLYQWIGLAWALLLSWNVAKWLLQRLEAVGSWGLRCGSSALSAAYVAHRLQPVTWMAMCWLFFKFPVWLDLPVTWLNTLLPARTILQGGLLGWIGFQMIDLLTALYTNSELLRPHRSLGDLIVPAARRFLKATVLLLVVGYVIYEVGHGESLLRFLTGLGIAGLAASLAAQDILRSFFGTLLLIGEHSFKLGDRIRVEEHEGIVEQVGFRSTRLRTADGSVVTVPNARIISGSILCREAATASSSPATEPDAQRW